MKSVRKWPAAPARVDCGRGEVRYFRADELPGGRALAGAPARPERTDADANYRPDRDAQRIRELS
jgi:hypothetical protein